MRSIPCIRCTLLVTHTLRSKPLANELNDTIASLPFRVLFTYVSDYESAHAFAQQAEWEGRVYATKLDQVCTCVCSAQLQLDHTTQCSSTDQGPSVQQVGLAQCRYRSA